MLRITVTSDQQRAAFKAEGKLTNQWVEEAEKAWMVFSNTQGRKRVVVDLCSVSFVDDLGRELLAKIHASGATLVGTGPMMLALIDEICGSGQKPRRKWMRSVLSLLFLTLLFLAASNGKIAKAQDTATGATPLTLERALVDAGIMRLRPVMITIGPTVLALFPLALHSGLLWKPLCYSQFGGLCVVTFLILLLMPALYAILCSI